MTTGSLRDRCVRRQVIIRPDGDSARVIGSTADWRPASMAEVHYNRSDNNQVVDHISCSSLWEFAVDDRGGAS